MSQNEEVAVEIEIPSLDETEKIEFKPQSIVRPIAGPEILEPPPKEIDPSAPLGSRMNPLGVPVRPMTAMERKVCKAKKVKVPKAVSDFVQEQDVRIKELESTLENRVNYARNLEDAIEDMITALGNACVTRGALTSLDTEKGLEILALAAEKVKDPAQKIQGDRKSVV